MDKTIITIAAAVAFAAVTVCADYTDYYLIGSDVGNNCPLDGRGSPKGWSLAADNPAQESKAANDPDGIYHINGRDGGRTGNTSGSNANPGVIRGALASANANYTFAGHQLVFDGFCPAMQVRQENNKTITFDNVLVVAGVNGEFRSGQGTKTPIVAGSNWVVEEGATLGLSACENARGLTCSATITGGGKLAAVGGLDEWRGYAATGSGKGTARTVTFSGDLSAFEGVFSAGERSNCDLAYGTYAHADCVDGLKCVIAASTAFPSATPDGDLFERSIVVTNGATISFTCNVLSPAERGWDFGDGAVPTVNVDAGCTVSVFGPVKGSVGFKKTGAGTLVLNVGGAGVYDTMTLTGASTVSAATLSAYVAKCDVYVAALNADSMINVTSDYTAGGLPDIGVHADLQDGQSYTSTAPAFVAIDVSSRARCTGWNLYDGSNTLVRSSSDLGEDTLSCVIPFHTGDIYRLAWQWTVETASTPSAPSVTISRRVFTLSGSLASVGVGTTHVLVKWDNGEWTDVGTFTAGSASTAFTSTHTGIWEVTSTWQVMCSNVCDGVEGPSTVSLVSTTLSGTCIPADTATYTWTGRGSDDLWTNSANWSDNSGGDCIGYPASTGASVVFPNLGGPYTVELTQDALVKKMTFNSPDVTLKGVGASVPKITPSENSAFTVMTLDHAEVYRKSDHSFPAGTVIHLKNGAKATVNNCKLNAAGGTSLIKLEGGSTFQAGGLWIGCGNEIVIDDSEFISTAAFSLGDTATGGKIVFKGAAPKMTLNGSAFCGANMNGSNFSLEFHLPVGGYASAPITTTGNYYYFGAPNNSKTGTVTLNVASAEGDGTGEYTCPLVVWQKGLDSNGYLLLGSLPTSATSAFFAFADTTADQVWDDDSTIPFTAKSLGVHIVEPRTETVSWTDYTSPDGFWTAVADGEGNVVFTFTGGNNSAALRYWLDGEGHYLTSVSPMTLPVEDAAGVVPVFSRIWHVATTGDDANDGATEATAKATPGAGYALLSSIGDRLLIHPGAYTNGTPMTITNGWQVIGVGGAESTILNVISNFTSFRFVKDKGGDMGVVRGFTIAPANGIRQAHQVANQNGWGLFADCIVTNIGTTKDDVAIRQSTVDCVISNCVFYGSQSSGATGSAIQHWTAGQVLNCKFFDCAGSNGRYGGAVTVGTAGSVVRDCLFVNCVNTGTGGAISFYGAGLVENCTIIGCRSTGTVTGGGGIDVFNSPGTVRNCIVYGCENDAGPANIKAGKGIVVEYTATAPLFDGTGNIALAEVPDFADPEGGDYRVLSGVTIDAGLNQPWMADAPDLAGTNRIIGAAVDLGCYECAPQGLRAAIQPSSSAGVGAGSEITLTALVSAADTNGLTYTWSVTDKSGATVFTASGADCESVAHAYAIGLYSVSLTVENASHESCTTVSEDLFCVKPETIWVNNAATETYPYDTKSTGFTNIVDAVAFAESGMKVILAAGVQTNTSTAVVIAKAVEICGEDGFGSATYYTTKNLTLNSYGSAVRGLTLLSNYKTECYVSVQIGTLDSCVITNFTRGYCTLGASSGGLVTNCTVVGCRNSGRDRFVSIGGGMIVNSRIIRNKTTNGSYNALLRLSGGLARGCLIADNESVAGNDGQNNAFAVEGSGTIENCTIVNNADTCEKRMPAIGSGITVVNCIVTGNTNLDGPSGANSAASATYTLCDVAGLSGEGCPAVEPISKTFPKIERGDYTPDLSSAACNGGVNMPWMDGALDLLGNPRILRKTVDMGCIENTRMSRTLIILR